MLHLSEHAAPKLLVSWTSLTQPVLAFLGARAAGVGPPPGSGGCANCALDTRWAPILDSLLSGTQLSGPLVLSFDQSTPETTLGWLRNFLAERGASSSVWCTVTEIDARQWLRGWLGEGLEEDEDERFDRTVTAVEHSDLVVIPESEPLTLKERTRVEKTIRILRPEVEVVFLPETSRSEYALSRRFSWDRSPGGCAWKQATSDNIPEAFVYRVSAPFHPERFASFIDRHQWLGYRAAGTLWLLTRPELAVFASRTGFGTLLLEPEGHWVATLPPAERAIALSRHAELIAKWDPKHGDRQTELVFLGLAPSRVRRLSAELDACLATPWERAAYAHGRLQVNDPLTGDWGNFNEEEETAGG